MESDQYMKYQYNDIELSVVNDLNSRILNTTFNKLIENDESIIPSNNYIPNIWENKWFNNNVIRGYSKGDAVWKYTMTSSEFISTYHNIIYDYAQNNKLLNGYFRYSRDAYMDELDRYQNVISGYSVQEPLFYDNGNVIFDTAGKLSTHNVQYLLPLFDYGAYDSINNQPIEIYISLINDNKELLSNTNAWHNIILSDYIQFNKYISTELNLLFNKHIEEYHLGGISSNQEFANILVKKDFSNFEISSLYNTQKILNHNQYINDQGFDFVKEFKKTSNSTRLKSSNMNLYNWCRLWNSGHLEHGGIVEIPQYTTLSSNNVSCYVISIDFTWNNTNNLIYDYETSDNFYGNITNNLYFLNGVQIDNYNLSSQLKLDNRYVINITPVQFNSSDLSTIDNIIINENTLSNISYPSTANNDKNKTFVNYEVHSITNSSFCITRSRTDDLRKNNDIRYIQYYVSGYRTLQN